MNDVKMIGLFAVALLLCAASAACFRDGHTFLGPACMLEGAALFAFAYLKYAD